MSSPRRKILLISHVSTRSRNLRYLSNVTYVKDYGRYLGIESFVSAVAVILRATGLLAAVTDGRRAAADAATPLRSGATGEGYSSAIDEFPTPVLRVIVEDPVLTPALMGFCAGYERGAWRHEQLAEYLMNWLLDFALSDEELERLGSFSARAALKRAATVIYETDKYGKRGEFGELLLHAILRQHRGTLAAIKKIFFKDASNDVVKGFDAVHVYPADDGLELWLGEAKFYSDLGSAIRDVGAELERHTQTDYLRAEFTLITNKLDRSFADHKELARLLDPATSLDEVFERIRVPVLLTYDSELTASHQAHSPEYLEALEAELRDGHARYVARVASLKMVVHLFLVPMATKADLQRALDTKLKGLQA